MDEKKRFLLKEFSHLRFEPNTPFACAFAPSNVALSKYWGKRSIALNLPDTPSLSVSLGNKGASSRISSIDASRHRITLNGEPVPEGSSHDERFCNFLDLFSGPQKRIFKLDIVLNLPVMAGLASSAAIFASIVKAFDTYFHWNLTRKELSVLARLGSGSAARSLWQGFVELNLDGSASALSLDLFWPAFRVGIVMIDERSKKMGSTEGMMHCAQTSPLYASWKETARRDMQAIREAILKKNLGALGPVVEGNAIAMHATMLASRPPLIYSTKETLNAIETLWKARREGLDCYFTQDAGPNIKLLFLDDSTEEVLRLFPGAIIIDPYEGVVPELVSLDYSKVVLVDPEDRYQKFEQKIAAHEASSLHRAISVFIFRQDSERLEILLQKRHQDKYHSKGLWSNACCSHPAPGEGVLDAGQRRLREEMGIFAHLDCAGSFIYKADVGGGLIEHELDHVLVGFADAQKIAPCENEIEDWRWVDIQSLRKELLHHSENFTPWFEKAFTIAMDWRKRYG